MRCQSGVCVVKCDNTEIPKGDGLCEAVSPALTCVDSAGAAAFCSLKCGASNACATGTSCLTSQNACLPTGSFLGSPCAGGTTCSGSPPIICYAAQNVCALDCGGQGSPDAYCAGAAPSFGQTWDKCQLVAAGVNICIDSTP
jgi:hypothetical protein